MIILASDAIIKISAVMIEILDAPIAGIAMIAGAVNAYLAMHAIY